MYKEYGSVVIPIQIRAKFCLFRAIRLEIGFLFDVPSCSNELSFWTDTLESESLNGNQTGVYSEIIVQFKHRDRRDG